MRSRGKRDITDEIKMQDQLRQAQKMEAIGTLAGGIAHDFNNILQAICSFTELAMYDLTPDSEIYKHLEKVSDAGKRATELVRQILTFSRQQEQTLLPIRIQSVLKEALKLLSGSLPATIRVRPDIDNDCETILADPTQIHQVVMNLCTNAYHAMREKGGVLTVRLMERELLPDRASKYADIDPGKFVSLVVQDSGCGMDEETRERIFEPFFTTKKEGEGTGMGLATLHGIVLSHNGAITVESQPGEGTTFEVLFPIHSIGSATAEKKSGKQDLPKGNETVLFVDDEGPIVAQGLQVLTRLGYTVVGCTNSIDALVEFQKEPDRFDMVVTDYTMPNMTGMELATNCLNIRPDLPIILCTGFSDQINKEKAEAAGIQEFVQKPILPSNLASLIRDVLDKSKTDQL